MLKQLTVDSVHYATLARLLWKHGRHDLLQQLGWVQSDQENETQADPEAIARDIEDLGTAYIKLAQLASTRTDIMPPEFIAAFSRLQDDVKAVDSRELVDIIEADLGNDLQSLYFDFETEPLAAASLAQVHRAKVSAHQDVVVKIRRPGVDLESKEQLASLRRLAAIVDSRTDLGRRFQFTSLAGAVDYALGIELDYHREAAHLEMLRNCADKFSRILVPNSFDEYCSSRVLTMDYISGAAIKDITDDELAQVEPTELAHQLVRFYLHQLIAGGFFHADPHPGNLILTPDKKLALIDAGLVVKLSASLKHSIAALLVAISEGDGERAAEIVFRISDTPEHLNIDQFSKETARVVASYGGAQLQHASIASAVVAILNACSKHDVQLPYEITLLCKTFVQLEMTLNRLDPNLDFRKEVQKSTMQLLESRASNRLDVGNLVSAAIDSTQLALSLPSRVDEFTRLAASNGLKVKVDAIDEAKLMAGLRKIANRITCGLVLAAMIIGASLVLSRHNGLDEAGWASVPGLAIIMLVISGGLAFILSWKAMFSDEH